MVYIGHTPAKTHFIFNEDGKTLAFGFKHWKDAMRYIWEKGWYSYTE